jgi:hypothetical protein
MKTEYSIKLDPASGEFHYLTPCPYGEDAKVGSNDCFRCKSFAAFVHRYPSTIAVECNHALKSLEMSLFQFLEE